MTVSMRGVAIRGVHAKTERSTTLKRPRPTSLMILLGSALLVLAGLGWWYLGTYSAKIEGRPAYQWVNDLENPDRAVVDAAMATLARGGETGVPWLAVGAARSQAAHQRFMEWAAPRLRLPFQSNPGSARGTVSCIVLLGQIGTENRSAHRVLIDALQDQREEVRAAAISALTALGARASGAMGEALTGGEVRRVTDVLDLMRSMKEVAGLPLAEVVGCLGHNAPSVRRQAVGVLAKQPLQPDWMDRWLGAARDPDAGVREAVARAMPQVGRTDSRSREVLNGLLRDPELQVMVAAAAAVADLGGDGRDVVPFLTKAVGQPRVGWQAAYLLSRFGRASAPAVGALVLALQKERGPRPLRESPSSAVALGRIGEPAVAAVTPLLRHRDRRVRLNASIALGIMGQEAKAAVPELVRLLGDPDAEVQQGAAIALGGIAPDAPGLIPVLKRMIRANDMFVSDSAERLLRKISPNEVHVAGPDYSRQGEE